ncbi:TetR family transcriptional regulator [Herbidospora mongoliensis]|uniref:TetR family transcriptional regulator n=1 Tax=Herbidospora mongoliensis TaxID=688067 RepID=UPI00082FEC34|nr:TetR family transcriptional regulator [Herbidospora mongoliensis]
MRVRDPDTKKQLLLAAALAEFAEHGVAGARVDRLAKRAGVSAGHVYSFYDGKEGLFEAVYDAVVEQTVDGIPIDADDLPEYAGRLYDAGLAHPQVMRFVAWYMLERGEHAGPRASVTGAMAAKVAVIADAQRRGVVTDRIAPGEVLSLVLTIANMWHHQGEETRALVPAESRRSLVVDSVRRLVAP